MKIVLPVGRIVQGGPTFKQDKDMQGRPKDKPNWFMAIACPKADCTQALQTIYSVAAGFYQANVAVMQRLNAGPGGGFAWKVEDGDLPANRGKEGYAGCWIFKLSTSLGPARCYDRNNQPMDPDHVKRGYYVQAFVTIAPNENIDQTAGVYVNPDGLRFVAFGPEILSGPTAEEMFGAAPPPVPVGGSLTPIAAPGGNVFGNVLAGAQPQPGYAPPTGGPLPGYDPRPQPQPGYTPPAGAPGYTPPAYTPPAGAPGAPFANAPVQGAAPYAPPAEPAASAAQQWQTGIASPSSYPGAGQVFRG